MMYGVLEICITLCAVLYFVVYSAYDAVYPTLFRFFNQAPVLFTLVKFSLAMVLFFPAAFFMGGTLPVMTQHLVRNSKTLGQRASLLYAINTFGAASGAVAAGFYLPQTLGVDTSYWLAMGVTLLVGVMAMIAGRSTSPLRELSEPKVYQPRFDHQETSSDVFSSKTLTALAFLSGFSDLALQVLWVRMFAQVLHNSVYSYAAILAVFLISLAMGGVTARELINRHVNTRNFLPLLFTVNALLVAGSPTLFHSLTGGGAYIGGNGTFADYLLQVFLITTLVIGIPTVAMGVVLPYLFKLAENGNFGPGETVGRLVTINTLGAIFGLVVAGFILLQSLGLWASLKTVAVLYLVAGIWLLLSYPTQSVMTKAAPILGLLILTTVLDTTTLPLVRIDAIGKNETLLKVWEGADATVAVVRRDGHLRTKLNNWYTLGGTADMADTTNSNPPSYVTAPQPKERVLPGFGHRHYGGNGASLPC